MTPPTNKQIVEQYLADRAKIRALRAKLDELVAPLEQFQKNRETYLLQQEDPELFDFLTDLYLNGRDGKATAEAKKKDLGMKQADIEKWLLKMLEKLKSKGFKTEHGTVFPTRKEAVSVEDWDAFLNAEILRPAAEEIWKRMSADELWQDLSADDTRFDAPIEVLIDILRSAAHLEFINKGVNKTSVLERMGDRDEKDDSRPNPAPAGVKYTAMKTVGVRSK